MFIGLKDFDIDIFLRLDDEDIDIYYEDFETIPSLINYVPLGSFDDEGKLKLTTLEMLNRINVGMEFLHRDFFAEYEEITRRPLIRVDRFLDQFGNIPEVVEFFDPYLSMCDSDTPPDWCTTCTPDTECPDYCDTEYDSCAISIPAEEFLKIKGDSILRFGISVPTQDMINDPLKTAEATVFSIDSDGSTYTASDTASYVLTPTTSRLRRNGVVSSSGTAIILDPISNGFINATERLEDLTISGTTAFITDSSGKITITFNERIYETNVYSSVFSVIIPAADVELLEINATYTATALHTIEGTGVIVQDTEDVVVSDQLTLDPISDGFINIDEHLQPLAITGSTKGIPDGYQVTIEFAGEKYYTEITSDYFAISISEDIVRRLPDGVSQTAYAKCLTQNNEWAEDAQSVYVDLARPEPSITIDTIPPVGQTTEYTLVSGVLAGDARVGDRVEVVVNGVTQYGNVYSDTKYPGIGQGYEIDYSDMYFLIVLYFNGIYRTSPQNAQDFGTYELLTDINFELNNYSVIIDIKEFFTLEFINYLKCIPGSLPFANDYGTKIKLAVQTKNFIVQQLEVESEINYFINNFNLVYGGLINVKSINLVSRESEVGADSWLVEVFADVTQDRMVYRLEI